MSHQVSLTLKSKNAKTGPIPVSTTTATTCPDACPFKRNGCYADGGPLAIQWRKVTEGKAGMGWSDFIAAVAALPAGQLWRHNQAGDLPGNGDAIDATMLEQLVSANMGKVGFTYTHKPMTTENIAAVRSANANGFVVNLSGNSLPHADELSQLEAGPVVCVLPAEVDGSVTPVLSTPAGRKVAVCPATYRDNVSCASCGLCARLQRKVIVGFPAHGAAKRKASAVASA